jgi:hypothetical protein
VSAPVAEVVEPAVVVVSVEVVEAEVPVPVPVVFEAVVDEVDEGLDDEGVEELGIDDDGADEVGVEEEAEVFELEPEVPVVLEDEVEPVVLGDVAVDELGVVDELAEVDGDVDEPVVDDALEVFDVPLVPTPVLPVIFRSAADAPLVGVLDEERRLLTSWQFASIRMPVQVGCAGVPAAGVCDAVDVDDGDCVCVLWGCEVGVPLWDCAWGAPQAMNAERSPNVRVFMRIPR